MLTTDTHVLFHSGADALSNWHATPMVVSPAPGVDPVAVSTGEQLFMAKKALRFGDAAALGMILSARTPRDQKAAGRAVAPFDRDAWFDEAPRWMFEASVQKYACSPGPRRALLASGGRRLVEASPFDGQWGTGLGERHPRACDPAAWTGLNRLGRVLEMVRWHFSGPAGRDVEASIEAARGCLMERAWSSFDASAFAGDARPW